MSCEVNGIKFEAEGERSQVLAKLDDFLRETLAPIRKALEEAAKGTK